MPQSDEPYEPLRTLQTTTTEQQQAAPPTARGKITVMFWGGSKGHVHDEAQFRKLLDEATSPEPPTRRTTP